MRIYKGEDAAETYLFVAVLEDLERVPDALLEKMGTMAVVMEIDLKASKRLVRVTGDVVMAAIDEQGYYIQLPPAPGKVSRRETMHERFTK